MIRTRLSVALSKRFFFAALIGWFTIVTGVFRTAVGQETESSAKTAVTIAPAGVQRYARGSWASLAVVAANRTAEDSEEVVSVFVGDDPNLQFSKKFWVPAFAQRQTWLPIAIPADDLSDADRVNLSMIRIDESDGGESFTKNAVQMPVSQRSVMLTDRDINTGLFGIASDLQGIIASEERYARLNAFLNAGRDSATTEQSDLPIITFHANFLPPTHNALEELDQAVIAGDQLLRDSEGLVALRRWIRGGGRAWIMLDLTSQKLVDELFGSNVDLTVIDRVELNDFKLETLDPIRAQATTVDVWSSETPVDLVRVMAESDEISSRIDGWPVAFWKRFGDGEVLFTTLGTAGWMQSSEQPTAAYTLLARRFFEPKNQPENLIEAMTPIVDDQIGYEIPSRRIAGLVLGFNALIIFAAGLWWARQRRLERMAILVPASAIITTVIMLSVGAYHARAVPSTVASSQIVRVRGATEEADLSTVHAVYSQQTGQLGLISRHEIATMPLEQSVTTETRRVRWDDNGESRWLGPGQPPGVVRHMVSDSTVSLDPPIRVRGTFDADGFRGTLAGLDAARCEDGLVGVSPGVNVAVTFDAASQTGEVIAKASDVLPPGQFIPGSILSDRQRIRQTFLNGAFGSPETNSLAKVPSLLLWTVPVDTGVQFDDRFDKSGSALYSIPIQIDRPAPGSDFHVPATFIRANTFLSDRGSTVVFNPRTGQWLSELTNPVEAELRFEFPKPLRSMTLKRVNVTIKINAPSRTFFVKALVDGQPTTVYQQDNATGLLQFTIDRGDALELDNDVGLWLALGVTESKEAVEKRAAQAESGEAETTVVDNTTWQIDYVHLDAVGRIETNSRTSNVEASETGKP